jgi:hypothetical protein
MSVLRKQDRIIMDRLHTVHEAQSPVSWCLTPLEEHVYTGLYGNNPRKEM